MRRQVELYISNREINPEDLLEIPNYDYKRCKRYCKVIYRLLTTI